MKNPEWQSRDPEQRDFYQKLRVRIRDWASGKDASTHKSAELIMAAPDLFHLLCKLTTDPRVPAGQKTKLALVIAYFISPLDLMPELIFGPIGFADDVALTAIVLKGLMESVGEEVVREHWAGDEDVLALIQRVIDVADRSIGRGLVAKLRKMLS